MNRRFILAGLFLSGLAAAGAVYTIYKPIRAQAPASRASVASVPVVVISVAQKPMPVQLTAIGTVQPIASVAIRSRVDSQIVKVHFNEGDSVTAGDVLFTLDGRAVEAQLKQVEAALIRDQAQLANVRRDMVRYEQLSSREFASRQKYDEVRTNADVLAATIRSDEAAVESLKVQLGYYLIRAPISGRAGAVSLKAGNVIRAGDSTTLVTINQIDPIYVSFAVPQRYYGELRAARDKRGISVQIALPGDDVPIAGSVGFMDNVIDSSTSTLTLKAVVANAQERLWPGAFVTATLNLSIEPAALVVPEPAVQMGQEGPYVFVVKADRTVEMRRIVVKRSQDGESVIAEGLRKDEQVVVDGQLRLVDGARVEVRPSGAPATDSPRPSPNA